MLQGGFCWCRLAGRVPNNGFVRLASRAVGADIRLYSRHRITTFEFPTFSLHVFLCLKRKDETSFAFYFVSQRFLVRYGAIRYVNFPVSLLSSWFALDIFLKINPENSANNMEQFQLWFTNTNSLKKIIWFPKPTWIFNSQVLRQINIHAWNFSKYKMNFFKAYILFVSKKGRGNKSESVYTSVDFTSAEIKARLGSAVFEIAVVLCCRRII